MTPATAQVYYIYTDQLNTPRAITNQAQQVVWRWDNQDPFGANVPDEDSDGDGQKFTCNLRFPGQYFDKETNLNYNYFRDYDPSIGRYIESDLVGLLAGVNTYTYVRSNPLSFIDKFGLDRYSPCTVCTNFLTRWICKQSIDQACKGLRRFAVMQTVKTVLVALFPERKVRLNR